MPPSQVSVAEGEVVHGKGEAREVVSGRGRRNPKQTGHRSSGVREEGGTRVKKRGDTPCGSGRYLRVFLVSLEFKLSSSISLSRS